MDSPPLRPIKVLFLILSVFLPFASSLLPDFSDRVPAVGVSATVPFDPSFDARISQNAVWHAVEVQLKFFWYDMHNDFASAGQNAKLRSTGTGSVMSAVAFC